MKHTLYSCIVKNGVCWFSVVAVRTAWNWDWGLAGDDTTYTQHANQIALV